MVSFKLTTHFPGVKHSWNLPHFACSRECSALTGPKTMLQSITFQATKVAKGLISCLNFISVALRGYIVCSSDYYSWRAPILLLPEMRHFSHLTATVLEEHNLHPNNHGSSGPAASDSADRAGAVLLFP